MPQPCFWYNADAKQAFTCYLEAFPEAQLTIANGFFYELQLGATRIAGMNGGPKYRPNLTLSVQAHLPKKEAIDEAYEKLLGSGGQAFLPLGSYDWSLHYGWVEDAWGVSWQLFHSPDREAALYPALMYTGEASGKAAQALAQYQAVLATSSSKNFGKAEVLRQTPYGEEAGENAGLLMQGVLQVQQTQLIVYDSATAHQAAFSPGGSLMMLCDTQAEIDHYWKTLTAEGGAPGRCGWLTDRFGVSWQIIPRQLSDWLSNPQHAGDVGQAMQGMTKLIIDQLKPAQAASLADQLAKQQGK